MADKTGFQVYFDEWKAVTIELSEDEKVWLGDATIDELAPIHVARLLAMSRTFATIKLDDFYYPRDWWEAFKERWSPAWAKKKYHVHYKHISVSHYLPEYQQNKHLSKHGRVIIDIKNAPCGDCN